MQRGPPLAASEVNSKGPRLHRRYIVRRSPPGSPLNRGKDVWVREAWAGQGPESLHATRRNRRTRCQHLGMVCGPTGRSRTEFAFDYSTIPQRTNRPTKWSTSALGRANGILYISSAVFVDFIVPRAAVPETFQEYEPKCHGKAGPAPARPADDDPSLPFSHSQRKPIIGKDSRLRTLRMPFPTRRVRELLFAS